jgi:hypothetical protein
MGAWLWAAGAVSCLADDFRVTSVMFEEPELELVEPKTVFSPRLKALWLLALARSEADLQRQAADSITRAQRLGMPGLAETAAPLMRALETPMQHPVVRLAAARALIAIEARDAAATLWEHARKDGLDMAQLVEPVLAAWNFAPAQPIWLERLSNPRTDRRLRILAIRGLQVVGARDAAPALRELALAPRVSADIRAEAAAALGSLKNQGSEADARKLTADKSAAGMLDRLVAARMLADHQGEAAQPVLLDLAVDSEPAVAAIAWHRLFAIDPTLTLPLVEAAASHPDANLRGLAVRTLTARPSVDRIARLGTLLDDPHPAVRLAARNSLRKLADDEPFHEAVRDAGLKMLATDSWRGLEQSLLLLTDLDEKSAAPRFLELLEFGRPEVMVTAAFGLRRLAVAETLEPLLDKARRQTVEFRTIPRVRLGTDEQLSQILQMFGEMNYAAADPLLREYVPKARELGILSRGAAIWALGHLHAGRAPADLGKAFTERLTDTTSTPPEDPLVRQMSAVGLGRMGIRDALPVLRRYADSEPPNSKLGASCRWAVESLTGEKLPPREADLQTHTGWFLEPLEDKLPAGR